MLLVPAGDRVHWVEWADGRATQMTRSAIDIGELPGWVASRPADTRWVWADSSELCPALLRAGVRVTTAVDLRLVHRILRQARAAAGSELARAEPSAWDAPPTLREEQDDSPTLFDSIRDGGFTVDEVVAEHAAQQRTLAELTDRGRLRLLCHAESIGGVIAQELNHVGVPFSAAHHDQQLRALLGEPSAWGGRPARMEQLCREIRARLDDPHLNPDSPVEVIKVLRRQGLQVESTRQWELEQLDHPVVEPLLAYKKLARLHSANGWAWMESWVRNGRFHSDWVAGGVVTGRWASRGGGGLQLPHQIRSAVRAEPGWSLVVADAAQLEPRVLAAMAVDEMMAGACQGTDLYQGLVDQGIVDTREHAKVGVLAAMYGSTSGEAAALLPRLARAYPRAMGVVESAARAGERGEQVATWLGRTSPVPPEVWQQAQSGARGSDADAERRARRASRGWGRFTRNFVVQGTAAEWALCWLGHLRRELGSIRAADGSAPELVYFLHDEVMVHTPAGCAEQVAEAVREAARRAGELLFGRFPVEFALSVAVVDSYDQAK